MISDDFSSDGLESCWKVLSIKNDFSFLFHLITFFFLTSWEYRYSKIILKAKSSKALQRQNFHFLVFNTQFGPKTKPLALSSVQYFMQGIAEDDQGRRPKQRPEQKYTCIQFL